MAVKDSYPIPSMDKYIDLLGSAKVFSTSEAYSRYRKVSIKEQDRDKNAFVFHARTFRFRRMPSV